MYSFFPKKGAILLLLLLSTAHCSAQSFQFIYETLGKQSYVQSIQATQDGGYIVCGRTKETSGDEYEDIYLMKLDQHYETLWSKTYGGIYTDEPYNAIQTSDGGYAVLGESDSFSSSRDIYLFKTDGSGNLEWSLQIDGAISYMRAVNLKEAPDGNLIIAGTVVGELNVGIGWAEFYVLNISSSGQLLWTKLIGGADDDDLSDLIVQDDGSIVLLGYTNSFSAVYRHPILLKLDANGNLKWSKVYQSAKNNYAIQFCETNNQDGFVVVGRDCFATSEDCHGTIIKTDSIGNVVWSKYYAHPVNISDDVFISNVLEDHQGGYLLSGNVTPFKSKSTQDTWDIFQLRMEESGAIDWLTLYGGDQTEVLASYGKSSITTPQGYLSGGGTSSFHDESHSVSYLVGTDISGNTLCYGWDSISFQVNDLTVITVDPSLQIKSEGDTVLVNTSVNDISFTRSVLCSDVGFQEFQQKQVHAYPNPVMGVLFLEAEDAVEASLVNTLGESIQILSLKKGRNVIDMREFSPGIYYLRSVGFRPISFIVMK